MKIQWPTAIVLIVFLIALATAYLAGPALGVPESSHDELVTGLGLAGAVILAAMRGVFARASEAAQRAIATDSDGDGLPDFLDRPTPADSVPTLDELDENGGRS